MRIVQPEFLYSDPEITDFNYDILCSYLMTGILSCNFML
jgi:hypothetical protein